MFRNAGISMKTKLLMLVLALFGGGMAIGLLIKVLHLTGNHLADDVADSTAATVVSSTPPPL